MDILNTLSLKSNRQIKINFNGGDLSSDAGLLLIKEFAAKIGFAKLIKKIFKTDDKSIRFHKDNENLMQMLYQIISAYFEDDCADELIFIFTTQYTLFTKASGYSFSKCFSTLHHILLLKYSCVTCNCFFNISLHI